MNKELRLLDILAEAHYIPDKWLTMEFIISATYMSSFNQRLQEWRKRGIDIRHRTLEGRSEYRLFTDPLAIDWHTFSLKMLDTPAEPKGKAQVKVLEQGEMFK